MRTAVRKATYTTNGVHPYLQAPDHAGRKRPSLFGCDEQVASLLAKVLDLGPAVYGINDRFIQQDNHRNKENR